MQDINPAWVPTTQKSVYETGDPLSVNGETLNLLCASFFFTKHIFSQLISQWNSVREGQLLYVLFFYHKARLVLKNSTKKPLQK